jgi:2-C-methyl-D-erythritol 2,4-cyclodiphosphate synthase
MTTRVGLGFDVHPFGGDGPLVLGGVTLDGPGLAGHSDADVVAHAVADALLGAAALGDLGTLFPATDERYRGVSSMGLLREVGARVTAAGWRVDNVDIIVAAEQPRLAPHVHAMVDNLGAALAPLDTTAIAVKPKRAEGLGAIGRAEGIAAWAVALLSTISGP